MAQMSTYAERQQHTETIGTAAKELGDKALERTNAAARNVGESVAEHPIATIAIIAGLAFAIGALWRVGYGRRRSPTEQLMSMLAQVKDELPRRWRVY